MQSNVNANENAPAAADSGRNGKGQFQLGNKGGPGNPFAGQVAALRQAVLEHVSADDIRDIIKGLVEMAKNGHWQAAKLILQYALGKPQPLPDPDVMPMPYEPAFAEPPSANGFFRDEPSTNGSFQEAPSTNGDLQDDAPSTNGILREELPSTNGVLREEPPSTNGVLRESPSTNGGIEPVLNRKQRRALKKAKRLAKKIRNSPPLVPLS